MPGAPGAQDEESAPAPAPPVEPDSPPPTSEQIDESPSAAPPAPLLEELPRRASSGSRPSPPRSDPTAGARPPLELSARSPAVAAPPRGAPRDWVESAVVPGDKVNALLLASPALRWAVTLSIVLPGGKLFAQLESPVAPKQASPLPNK